MAVVTMTLLRFGDQGVSGLVGRWACANVQGGYAGPDLGPVPWPPTGLPCCEAPSAGGLRARGLSSAAPGRGEGGYAGPELGPPVR